MDSEIARQLFLVADRASIIFFRTIPELPDFTIHTSGIIEIISQLGRVEILFNRSNIKEIVCLLDVSIFTSEKIIITWNIKNFISYVRYYSKKHREFHARIIDLKLIEGFMSDRKNSPTTFKEASERVLTLSKEISWKKVYDRINLPLATRVIPSLECQGIVDLSKKKIVYAHYEIDRAVTGRMTCQNLALGFNPHTLGNSPDYKPRGETDVFLSFDYRSMEIRMIQWLSGDPVLKEIIESKQEVYEAAWNKITKQQKAPEAWKSTFLALFYGLGVDELAKRQNWSQDVAREVIRLTRKTFSTAFDYLLDIQDIARKTKIKDYFGRPRDLMAEPYKARNFVIQSASNIVCMERLIDLHESLPEQAKIGYSVHDGYMVFCPTREIKDVARRILSVLEKESDLCPGLKLAVSTKAGTRLDRMKIIPWSFLNI